MLACGFRNAVISFLSDPLLDLMRLQASGSTAVVSSALWYVVNTSLHFQPPRGVSKSVPLEQRSK